MNEKQIKWFKKIGMAGFLFFLLKGILWLILGSTFYKWVKEFLLATAATLAPFLMEAQTPPFSLNEIKHPYSAENKIYNTRLTFELSKEKPFFCRLEDQLNEHKKTYFKFRLGSIDYSNQLEYAPYLQNKEQGTIYLR